MAVTDEAIEKIKEMIVSGALRPGDRLPRESELAAALGLSRSSLREAVRALALVRVLDVRHGDGTYVTSLDPGLLLEPLGFAVAFRRADSVPEFLAVRRVLEPAATAMAAVRIGEERLAELAALLDGLGDEPSARRLAACDAEFHRGIARSAGNSVLCSLLEGVSGATVRARAEGGPAHRDEVARALYEHRAILAALRDRDAEAARSWAAAHLAGTERWPRTAF
ncbi:FadR/GntR family transcriptional regulator [Streptomyces minutiscleroticus]|uniref:GntR family transcriptional regulator n=1 Tax=Streptomyces minutiscleroticus TaxID=68238 RepID=A0A918NTJ3_9ACTN|nr:FCD domain-containing protein [Streptomyces minutiscleroticus]GGX94929.1 GntR family transcriptional regulator [Streptomyces minutiscleroticus]